MSATDELWGTFAVDDHLRPGAFIAEILLFDRVVIPQPHKDDADQYREWVEAGWRPDELGKIIKKLGKLAVPVTWGEELRAKWQNQYGALSPADRASLRAAMAQGSAFDYDNIRTSKDSAAKWLTRSVLVNKIDHLGQDPRNDSTDEALLKTIRELDIDPAADIDVVVGYGTYAKFSEEIKIDVAAPIAETIDKTALLFRWDFVVPEEESNVTDEKYLDTAIDLSQHDEFRASRREFHEWRRRLIAKNVSGERARSEMNRCLKVYNEIAQKKLARKRRQTALIAAATTAPLIDVLVPGTGIGTATGVALGVGALLADRFLPAPQFGSREKFVALVHDSREAFGWMER